MTPNNKGQVEVQFNWIFVLIVGAIILGFFVTIAVKQKTASEQQINIDFFTNFEKALTGIASVQGKTSLYQVPNMELRYDCTETCDCAAYAGTSRANAVVLFSTTDKIIFSPNRLKGNSLLTQSKAWSFPFRVTNFLFMTSPEIKYLIEDTDKGKEIYDGLPPIFVEENGIQERAFDKQLFTDSIEGVSGNYKVKFVFTDKDPTTFPLPKQITDLSDSDVSAVKFTNDNGTDSVTFYQKKGEFFSEIGKSYLFGKETEFASIFSEDLNSYSCMMQRSFKILGIVSSIYDKKKYELNLITNSQNTQFLGCAIHYADTALNDISLSANAFDFKNPDPAEPLSLTQDEKSAENQNLDSIKASCPNIY